MAPSGGLAVGTTRPMAVAGPTRAGAGSVYDYGLIGNLQTTALVSRFGSVDWACIPHFASPSVFARLLDREHGGFAEVRPTRFLRSSQSYLPSTNILQTRFELENGIWLLLTDFMPIDPSHPTAGDPRIVRLLEAIGGVVPVELCIQPRFRYALEPAEWSGTGTQWLARGRSGDTLTVRTPWDADSSREGLSARGELAAGRRLAIELAWGRADTEERPEGLLLGTSTYWREWVHREHHAIHRIAAPWHAWVERSELLLKLLSHAETGAFIAAPTTSLPEWPGGTRNWDYRYVWIRDAAFTAQVLGMLGHAAEARAYLDWVVQRIDPRAEEGGLRVMYDAHGAPVAPERELEHLVGYDASRPVRVGNGAAEQLQLDIFGEVLDAAWAYRRYDLGLGFLRTRWPELSRLADAVVELWRLPDHGIWEIRGLPAEYTHSKLMSWVALDRAARLGEALGGESRVDAWKEEAEAVRSSLLLHGWDAEKRSFIQAVGRPFLDAATLRVPLTGFLPFDDPRVVSTIEAVRRGLNRGGFVDRYRAPDGFDEPEGAFLLCSFWLVECLARSGRRPLALRYWRALTEVASPLGLYSEEYDPKTRRPLGNYPQAFTHIGVLRASIALGLSAPRGERERSGIAG